MPTYSIIASGSLIAILLLLIGSCGGTGTSPAALSGIAPAPSADVQPVDLPTALPADGVQPWETGARRSSAINGSSDFTPGREVFLSGGDVSEAGEASTVVSGSVGSASLSYAIYRLAMGGQQPGVISVDANLRNRNDGSPSEYWIGLSNYGVNAWDWQGPFSDSHIRLSVPGGDYLSTLGNTFVTVAGFDGADFDVVGIGVNPRDAGDAEAPPAPAAAPLVTPSQGGLLLEWLPVTAADLAGYNIYYSNQPLVDKQSAGVQQVNYLEGGTAHLLADLKTETFVRISAVDVSGNESPVSPMASGNPLGGIGGLVEVVVSTPSGLIGESFTLTASGAAEYDFDLDGDGIFEMTGAPTGVQQFTPEATGIIRPAVRGTDAGNTLIALGGVSLIISGNSRPVASAIADPQSGMVPLSVTFTGTAGDLEDDPGELTYAWDFNGDGIFEADTNTLEPDPVDYTIPGNYNAKLRVEDSAGSWDVDTVTVLAVPQPGNQPPRAAFSPDRNSGPASLYVNFSADASSDPDGSIVSYKWDFDGDGVVDADLAIPSAAYWYTDPGYYLVQLTVTDDDGLTHSTTAAVVAQGDSAFAVDGPAKVGEDNAITLVHGLPAIAYVNDDENALAYVIAQDPAGMRWGEPVLVYDPADSDVSGENSLVMVDGRPAIAFTDYESGHLYFVQAADSFGSSWLDPVEVDSSLIGYDPDMDIIDGRPAIAFRGGGDLMFAIGNDVDGTSWTTYPAIDTVSSVYYPSLEDVDGFPAIAYYDISSEDLKYVRASTADGSGAWGTIQTLDSPGDVGEFPCLKVVDGYPAVSYGLDSASSGELRFIRAANAEGSAWAAYQIVDGTGSWGRGTSMDIVNGVPVIIYNNAASSLRFVQATSADGSAWGTPETLDSGSRGKSSSLVVLEYGIGASYWDIPAYDVRYFFRLM